MRRIVVGMSGASGAVYGKRVLELLGGLRGEVRGGDEPAVETHLILTGAARRTVRHELELEPQALERLAHRVHDIDDVGAPIASGSFAAQGMIIAPCSVRTLSAIAYGQSANLLIRAADVMLKERRPLVLMLRETPLHLGHLRAMTAAAEIGAVIAPPTPAMYARPESIEAMVTQTAAQALALLGIECAALRRWDGGV